MITHRPQLAPPLPFARLPRASDVEKIVDTVCKVDDLTLTFWSYIYVYNIDMYTYNIFYIYNILYIAYYIYNILYIDIYVIYIYIIIY
jgi:hypothetical protein